MHDLFSNLRGFIIAWTLCIAGCGGDQAKAPVVQEASWKTQIENVRSGSSDTIDVEAAVIRDAQLLDLADLPSLRVLKLRKGVVTDEGLAALSKLPALEELVLRESPITDAGAKRLAAFPALRIVNLPQSHIGDAGLRELAQIANLELLRLGSDRRLSVEALRTLEAAERLRFLHFIGIPLGDSELAALGELKGLESLYVDGGAFSDAAVERLLKNQPGIHLHFDQKHHDSDRKGPRHSH